MLLKDAINAIEQSVSQIELLKQQAAKEATSEKKGGGVLRLYPKSRAKAKSAIFIKACNSNIVNLEAAKSVLQAALTTEGENALLTEFQATLVVRQLLSSPTGRGASIPNREALFELTNDLQALFSAEKFAITEQKRISDILAPYREALEIPSPQ